MRLKRKILVIEDDLSIAGSLKKELEAEAYEVALATQGEEGLELAKHQFFDVVVTDLKMPGLSGSDLVRQLRCAQPNLPVIVMTAFGTRETVVEANQIGVHGFLPKPFEMSELLELVASAMI